MIFVLILNHAITIIIINCKFNNAKIKFLIYWLVELQLRNSGNCNLIGCVGCYHYMVMYNYYNPIFAISSCLIDIQRSRINFLIKSRSPNLVCSFIIQVIRH